jgi:hypothetical protein
MTRLTRFLLMDRALGALTFGFRPCQHNTPRRLRRKSAKVRVQNSRITRRNFWITSIPGETEVTTEALPDSTLPDELRKLDYDVRENGETERIIMPHWLAS